MKKILRKPLILGFVICLTSLACSKTSFGDKIAALQAAISISYIGDKGEKFSQTAHFEDQCTLKITRSFAEDKVRTIVIPLQKMMPGRTRPIVTDYDADFYWKAGQYSLEVKTENVLKAIITEDQRGLIEHSDYAYIYISPSDKMEAEKIRPILVGLIKDCTISIKAS